MKRIISIILCAIMVMAIIPASVFMASAAGLPYANDLSGTTDNGVTGLRLAKNTGTWSSGDITLNNNNGAITVTWSWYKYSSGVYSFKLNGAEILGVNSSNQFVINGTNYHTQVQGSSINAAHYVTTAVIDPATGTGTLNFDLLSCEVNNPDYIDETTTPDIDRKMRVYKGEDGFPELKIGTVKEGSNVTPEGTTFEIDLGIAIADTARFDVANTGNAYCLIDYVNMDQGGAITEAPAFEYVGYQQTPVDAAPPAVAPLYSAAPTNITVDGITGIRLAKTSGTWNTGDVALNNATGELTLKFAWYKYSNTSGNYSFKLNGTEIFNVPTNASIVIGDTTYTTVIQSTSMNKSVVEATVVIDPATGKGTLSFDLLSCNAKVDGTATQITPADRKMNIYAPDDTKKETPLTSFNIDLGAAISNTVKLTVDNTASGYCLVHKVSMEQINPNASTGGNYTNTYKVRFVAVGTFAMNTDEATEVGFKVVAGDKGEFEISSNVIYTELSVKHGTEFVTAEEYGADYITALTITNIPYNEGNSVTFTVTPFMVINGEKVEGKTEEITVTPELPQ